MYRKKNSKAQILFNAFNYSSTIVANTYDIIKILYYVGTLKT